MLSYADIQNFFLPPTPLTNDSFITSTRNILILIWVLLVIGNSQTNETFLLTGALCICVMHCVKYFYERQIKNSMIIENYVAPSVPLDQYRTIPPLNKLKIETPSKYRFCQDNRPIGDNQNAYSANHALSGPANPKTLAPVPVIAPIAAWDYWSEDYIVPRCINDSTNFDMLGSGFASVSQCGETCDLQLTVPSEYSSGPIVQTRVENGNYRTPQNDSTYTPIIEGYNGVYPSPNLKQTTQNQHMWINESGTQGDVIGCTYNPQQMLDHNIPSNLPTGSCQRQNVFNEYNKNMFTNTIQPNVFSRSEVIQPIQSNMGITFQQQFQPVTCEPSANGGTTYVTHDPRIVPPMKEIPRPPTVPDCANVYDPRTFGYGTSYRSYIDEMTGQPRFMYDDIDAVRQPNYIIRSNIDDAPWAHSYGPMNQEKSDGLVPNVYGRALVHNKFMQNAVSHREELQERYMNKVNNQVMWQRRMAPIHTRSTF